MSKKRAFTMVELIFVIVILGILAAVAVPRLNASRDDAEIAKFAANLATIYKDVQTYYIANGTTFTDESKVEVESDWRVDITKLTNVALRPLGKGVTGYLYIGGKECFTLYIPKDRNWDYLGIGRNLNFEEKNQLCAKMYETFEKKPELKALLAGQDYKDDTPDNLVNKPTDGSKSKILYRPLAGGSIEL